jgi:hypothetical protein
MESFCSGASLKSSHTTLSACFSTKHLLANNGPAMHKTYIHSGLDLCLNEVKTLQHHRLVKPVLHGPMPAALTLH